jgi:amino-acid N-acetyltransferase
MGLNVGPISSLPPLFTPAENNFVQTALQLTGASQPGSVSYATDGCWFTRLENLIVMGPGSIEQAHRPDEWIALDELERGVDVFQKFFEYYAVAPKTVCTSGDKPGFTQTTADEWSTTEKGSSAKNVTELHFRRATSADVQAVNNFLRPFVNEKKLLRRTQSEMESLVPSGFLAEAGGRLVGFSAVEIYSRKLAEIQCLAVEPTFQGFGIGSELVRRCVELARERGVMEVLAISSSDTFLQKLGFNYSLPDQKRALFCQLRSRDEVYGTVEE